MCMAGPGSRSNGCTLIAAQGDGEVCLRIFQLYAEIWLAATEERPPPFPSSPAQPVAAAPVAAGTLLALMIWKTVLRSGDVRISDANESLRVRGAAFRAAPET